jgi:starch phosphorylase
MPTPYMPGLPPALGALEELALDLRWTWSHGADALWARLDPQLWERTRSPFIVLQEVSSARLRALAQDAGFLAELERISNDRRDYMERPGWFAETHGADALKGVAYFSMEFGLGAALPLYAGGLGVLAGDYLKTASDLAMPMTGIGLLYEEGYFRQQLDAGGNQHEIYPFNEPSMMPLEPVTGDEDGWLRIPLELPGRTALFRVWQARVGRCRLYLLDSNDPLNTPADRGITGKLYGGSSEMRFLQELVLGVAGWRVVQSLCADVELCHINEGHAAFAVIERARNLALEQDLDFMTALWASRAGNIFTTHTPVRAGFDTFAPELVMKYLPHIGGALTDRGVTPKQILALGRANPDNEREPFNMAYLAQRGSARTLGVSRLHGRVSRQIFEPIFPRWPEDDIPIGHVTNGVHISTWDSAEADKLWTEACGKERWRVAPSELRDHVARVDDESIWAMRGAERRRLVREVRERLSAQLRGRGLNDAAIRQAESVFDANVLTLGFARRFTDYKRPNLLLFDRDRLAALLLDDKRPVQIVVAGKAHPADSTGKELIRAWLALANDPRFRQRVVFLEDYDISLAQELVQGVDVWINSPRRPWEACGTSGMKVLANGGLNFSVRDGWWDEAYESGLGWALGDDHDGSNDAFDARDMYTKLEREIIPEFYERDASGIPRAWVERIRRSMCVLTPTFSSTRMAEEYVEQVYLPLAEGYRARTAETCARAKTLHAWHQRLMHHWSELHIGDSSITASGDGQRISVPVLLDDLKPDEIDVELYAEPKGEERAVIAMAKGEPIPGAASGFIYSADVPPGHGTTDFTVRVVPRQADAFIPAECNLILWQK